MADKIDCGLTVYACPPEHAQTFLDLIETYGLTPDLPVEGPGIVLGTTYRGWGRTTTGVAYDIRGALSRDAGDCAWEVWQGVTADGARGVIFRHTPDLGTWDGSCDDEGHPSINDREMWRILKQHGSDATGVIALAKALGTPWATAFEAYPAAGERVTPPKIYEAAWDRRSGEILIGEPDSESDEAAAEVPGPKTRQRPQDSHLRAVDQALNAAGWTRCGEWLTVKPYHRFMTTEVYRTPEAAESAEPAGGES